MTDHPRTFIKKEDGTFEPVGGPLKVGDRVVFCGMDAFVTEVGPDDPSPGKFRMRIELKP